MLSRNVRHYLTYSAVTIELRLDVEIGEAGGAACIGREVCCGVEKARKLALLIRGEVRAERFHGCREAALRGPERGASAIGGKGRVRRGLGLFRINSARFSLTISRNLG